MLFLFCSASQNIANRLCLYSGRLPFILKLHSLKSHINVHEREREREREGDYGVYFLPTTHILCQVDIAIQIHYDILSACLAILNIMVIQIPYWSIICAFPLEILANRIVGILFRDPVWARQFSNITEIY